MAGLAPGRSAQDAETAGAERERRRWGRPMGSGSGTLRAVGLAPGSGTLRPLTLLESFRGGGGPVSPSPSGSRAARRLMRGRGPAKETPAFVPLPHSIEDEAEGVPPIAAAAPTPSATPSSAPSATPSSAPSSAPSAAPPATAPSVVPEAVSPSKRSIPALSVHIVRSPSATPPALSPAPSPASSPLRTPTPLTARAPSPRWSVEPLQQPLRSPGGAPRGVDGTFPPADLAAGGPEERLAGPPGAVYPAGTSGGSSSATSAALKLSSWLAGPSAVEATEPGPGTPEAPGTVLDGGSVPLEGVGGLQERGGGSPLLWAVEEDREDPDEFEGFSLQALGRAHATDVGFGRLKRTGSSAAADSAAGGVPGKSPGSGVMQLLGSDAPKSPSRSPAKSPQRLPPKSPKRFPRSPLRAATTRGAGPTSGEFSIGDAAALGMEERSPSPSPSPSRSQGQAGAYQPLAHVLQMLRKSESSPGRAPGHGGVPGMPGGSPSRGPLQEDAASMSPSLLLSQPQSPASSANSSIFSPSSQPPPSGFGATGGEKAEKRARNANGAGGAPQPPAPAPQREHLFLRRNHKPSAGAPRSFDRMVPTDLLRKHPQGKRREGKEQAAKEAKEPAAKEGREQAAMEAKENGSGAQKAAGVPGGPQSSSRVSPELSRLGMPASAPGATRELPGEGQLVSAGEGYMVSEGDGAPQDTPASEAESSHDAEEGAEAGPLIGIPTGAKARLAASEGGAPTRPASSAVFEALGGDSPGTPEAPGVPGESSAYTLGAPIASVPENSTGGMLGAHELGTRGESSEMGMLSGLAPALGLQGGLSEGVQGAHPGPLPSPGGLQRLKGGLRRAVSGDWASLLAPSAPKGAPSGPRRQGRGRGRKSRVALTGTLAEGASGGWQGEEGEEEEEGQGGEGPAQEGSLESSQEGSTGRGNAVREKGATAAAAAGGGERAAKGEGQVSPDMVSLEAQLVPAAQTRPPWEGAPPLASSQSLSQSQGGPPAAHPFAKSQSQSQAAPERSPSQPQLWSLWAKRQGSEGKSPRAAHPDSLAASPRSVTLSAGGQASPGLPGVHSSEQAQPGSALSPASTASSHGSPWETNTGSGTPPGASGNTPGGRAGPNAWSSPRPRLLPRIGSSTAASGTSGAAPLQATDAQPGADALSGPGTPGGLSGAGEGQSSMSTLRRLPQRVFGSLLRERDRGRDRDRGSATPGTPRPGTAELDAPEEEDILEGAPGVPEDSPGERSDSSGMTGGGVSGEGVCQREEGVQGTGSQGEEGNEEGNGDSLQWSLGPLSEACALFTREEVLRATANFSPAHLLGQGSAGGVYRGLLHGRPVAVKRLHNRAKRQRLEQEVLVLDRVRHPHVLALLGYCAQELCLVSEYLPGGDLQARLAAGHRLKARLAPRGGAAALRVSTGGPQVSRGRGRAHSGAGGSMGDLGLDVAGPLRSGGNVDDWEREEDEMLGEMLGEEGGGRGLGAARGRAGGMVERREGVVDSRAGAGAPLSLEVGVEVEEEEVTFGASGGRIRSPAPSPQGPPASPRDSPTRDARADAVWGSGAGTGAVGEHRGSGSLAAASAQADGAAALLQGAGTSPDSLKGPREESFSEEESVRGGASSLASGGAWAEGSEEGSPRGEAVAGGVLSWEQRVRIAAEVASALLSLHDHNFLHCDLKPGNVLLDSNGASKLVDLGLARQITEDPEDARGAPGAEGSGGAGGSKGSKASFTIKGTMGYIDPHRIQTGEVTPLSDVYALGLVLLQLLLGLPLIHQLHAVLALCGPAKPARDHRHAAAVLLQHLDPSAGPWPLSIARPLVHLALRAVERDPQLRPSLRDEIVPSLERLRGEAAAVARGKGAGAIVAGGDGGPTQAFPGGHGHGHGYVHSAPVAGARGCGGERGGRGRLQSSGGSLVLNAGVAASAPPEALKSLGEPVGAAPERLGGGAQHNHVGGNGEGPGGVGVEAASSALLRSWSQKGRGAEERRREWQLLEEAVEREKGEEGSQGASLGRAGALPQALAELLEGAERDWGEAGGACAADVGPLLEGAREGDAGSLFSLGRAYGDALWGMQRDPRRALRWFKEAAGRGHAEAEHKVGLCYRVGMGVERDDVAALAWWGRAARHGCARSWAALGRCYLEGWGAERDETEAVRCLRRGVGLRDPDSLYWLAECHLKGQGVAQDPGHAQRLLSEAASLGHTAAASRALEPRPPPEHHREASLDFEFNMPGLTAT